MRYLSRSQIQKLNEEFGYFRHKDAQGEVTVAFVRSVEKIHRGYRNKELNQLRTELQEYKDMWKRIMSEDCPTDEKHCTCVPALKIELAKTQEEIDNISSLGGDLQDIIDEQQEEVERLMIHSIEMGQAANIARQCAEAAEAELTKSQEEVEHWKNNHADMVMRNRALHDRPDLKDRAVTVNALYERAEAAEAELTKEQEENINLMEGYIKIELYKNAQHALESREMQKRTEAAEADSKRHAVDFFRWWYNKPGANTEQGYDDWIAEQAIKGKP